MAFGRRWTRCGTSTIWNGSGKRASALGRFGRSERMRILVTGHRGYIGTILTPMLDAAGHEVVGLDNDLYERCTFAHGGEIPEVPTILKDIRDVEVSDLLGFDAVL